MANPDSDKPPAEQRRRLLLIYQLSGLMDIGLAAVIGFLGLEFVEGEPKVDIIHMIGGGLLVLVGVATIWYGRSRYGLRLGDERSSQVFRMRD